MSAIYIHIPFCKQACHYCDFHFSTSLQKKVKMAEALMQEIRLRKEEFTGEMVETIYFGGGTPSILDSGELRAILQTVYENYTVAANPEITLEANPDDISVSRLEAWQAMGINRLSIGIQSFFEEDLKMMNRVHNAEEAQKCLREAARYFSNISLDLIYGIPGMDNSRWEQNIETALSFGISHISSYALTVEPKTALQAFIRKGIVQAPDDEVAHEHFMILVEKLETAGFIHYELSNFGKPGYFSKNNSGYWLGKKYIGIGPSAHSYNGKERGWNIANNIRYIKAIHEGILPMEKEELTIHDRYNEYVMTGLRTLWGVSLSKVEQEFGTSYRRYLEEQSDKFIVDHLLYLEDGVLRTTRKGKFLSDGIASDLFLIHLE